MGLIIAAGFMFIVAVFYIVVLIGVPAAIIGGILWVVLTILKHFGVI